MSPIYRIVLTIFGKWMAAILIMVGLMTASFGFFTKGSIMSNFPLIFILSTSLIGMITRNIVVSDLGMYILSSPISRKEYLRSMTIMAFLFLALNLAIGITMNIFGTYSAGRSLEGLDEFLFLSAGFSGMVTGSFGLMIYAMTKYSGNDSVIFAVFAMTGFMALLLALIFTISALTGDIVIGFAFGLVFLLILSIWTYDLSQKAFRAKDF